MKEAPWEQLASELPPPWRIAVAYAPEPARGPWVALLALDRRLARAALGASEPMLGQLRMAWWRDRFRSPADQWPEGDPLLAALRVFDPERGALEVLVDGWERAVGRDPGPSEVVALGEARAGAIVALARLLGCREQLDVIAAMARRWAVADLAGTLDVQSAGALAATADVALTPLPRRLRPLTILAEMTGRSRDRRFGVRGLLRILRLGMWGR